MAIVRNAKVGISEAHDLLPKGRGVYESVRRCITSEQDELIASVRSTAAHVLGQLTALHETMIPPLPNEVVGTIGDFMKEYNEYVDKGDQFGITDERLRLEDVADQLISVVFEYGYGTDAKPFHPNSGGTEM